MTCFALEERHKVRRPWCGAFCTIANVAADTMGQAVPSRTKSIRNRNTQETATWKTNRQFPSNSFLEPPTLPLHLHCFSRVHTTWQCNKKVDVSLHLSFLLYINKHRTHTSWWATYWLRLLKRTKKIRYPMTWTHTVVSLDKSLRSIGAVCSAMHRINFSNTSGGGAFHSALERFQKQGIIPRFTSSNMSFESRWRLFPPRLFLDPCADELHWCISLKYLGKCSTYLLSWNGSRNHIHNPRCLPKTNAEYIFKFLKR